MTSTTTETLTPSFLGEVLAAHQAENAPVSVRKTSKGLVSESRAFHRKGADNPTSLAVFVDHGSWSDRGREGGNAKEYARVVARTTLRDLIDRYGRQGPRPARPAPDERQEQAKAVRILADAHALWDRCVPVVDDGEVTAYLRGRGLDVGRVVDGDVARALPSSGSLPRGASCRDENNKWLTWRETGHRLVVPFFNVHGELSSLQARCIKPDVDKSKSKLSYGGAQTKGLMFANRLARGLLTRHEAARVHVLEVSRTTAPERAGVVVCEGLVNHVAWCVDASDADAHAPAVFGIGAGRGGWLPAYANAIDDGTRLLVDTDHDADGNFYANQIASTFESRGVELARMERAHG